MLRHLAGERRWQALPIEADEEGFRLGPEDVEDLPTLIAFAGRRPLEQHVVRGQPLIFEFLRIQYGGVTLYDSVPEYIQFMEENLELRQQGSTGPGNVLLGWGYRPLSLIGSVLTYETEWACDCSGSCPSSSIAWVTLDLATRRPPSVLALFDERSLVEAMKRDVCLGAALTAPQRANLTSFADVLHAFAQSTSRPENCLHAAEAFSQIAVVAYDSRTDEATVRFGFAQEIGPGHVKTSYLAMAVKPTVAFRTDLGRVGSGAGFFAAERRLGASTARRRSPRTGGAAPP